MLHPSSLESILLKSASMEVRSLESFTLSRLPWLTVSRSLPSDSPMRETGLCMNGREGYITMDQLNEPGADVRQLDVETTSKETLNVIKP